MIDEVKFQKTRDWIINRVKPDCEVYSDKEFEKIVRYKIKYAIISRRNKRIKQQKYVRKIKKLLAKYDKLSNFSNYSR